MTGTITQHNLFKPARSKAETKAETTDNTARSIIKAEADQREAKSARLRQARLENEANEADARPVAKPRRKRTTPARRARSSM